MLIWVLLSCLFLEQFLSLYSALVITYMLFVQTNIGFYFSNIQVAVLVLESSASKSTDFSE